MKLKCSDHAQTYITDFTIVRTSANKISRIKKYILQKAIFIKFFIEKSGYFSSETQVDC